MGWLFDCKFRFSWLLIVLYYIGFLFVLFSRVGCLLWLLWLRVGAVVWVLSWFGVGLYCLYCCVMLLFWFVLFDLVFCWFLAHLYYLVVCGCYCLVAFSGLPYMLVVGSLRLCWFGLWWFCLFVDLLLVFSVSVVTGLSLRCVFAGVGGVCLRWLYLFT